MCCRHDPLKRSSGVAGLVPSPRSRLLSGFDPLFSTQTGGRRNGLEAQGAPQGRRQARPPANLKQISASASQSISASGKTSPGPARCAPSGHETRSLWTFFRRFG